MLTFCAGLLAVARVDSVSDYTPAFFWSPKELGYGQNSEHLHTATSQDLEGAVLAIAGQGLEHKQSLIRPTGQPGPEVQLVFLADNFHTEAVRAHGAGLMNLENLLQTSPSSMSVPFTTRLPDQTRLFDTAKRLSAAEAESYFAPHLPIFRNGAPDTVVVELKAPATASTRDALVAHDEMIGRVCHTVSRGTSGNYAALLTGLQNNAAGNLPAGARGRVLSEAEVSALPYLHMTPTLLVAYMICFMLLIIFLSGFCCLFSLQTPSRFDVNTENKENKI